MSSLIGKNSINLKNLSVVLNEAAGFSYIQSLTYVPSFWFN